VFLSSPVGDSTFAHEFLTLVPDDLLRLVLFGPTERSLSNPSSAHSFTCFLAVRLLNPFRSAFPKTQGRPPERRCRPTEGSLFAYLRVEALHCLRRGEFPFFFKRDVELASTVGRALRDGLRRNGGDQRPVDPLSPMAQTPFTEEDHLILRRENLPSLPSIG